jgi:hypothetical protein
MYISFGIAKPRNKQYLAIENTDSFGFCRIASAKMPRHAPQHSDVTPSGKYPSESRTA